MPRSEAASTRWLAHSPNADGAGVAEPLRDHIRAVAERAREFAASFGADEQAYAAGLLHDLGKYADQFQRRLRDPREPGRDHWSMGAAILAAVTRERGLLPAVAVAGHHTGLDLLPAKLDDYCRQFFAAFQADSNRERFTETDRGLLVGRYRADGFELPTITRGLLCRGEIAADMLDARMLFSALTDADFLETEAHFQGDGKVPRQPRPEGPLLDPALALAALEAYRAELRNRVGPSPMSATRQSLYEQCVAAATAPQGSFSLAAPTGSGKTLAMLAFALHHAQRHGLRRIVLVMPFLNIIEQTAAIYREIFSLERGFDPHAVLEHHSLADGTGAGSTDGQHQEPLVRLLAENWDAPIILTTNVQLLESLMAHRPSRCRKLHRLAKSVILFDEVQTIPAPLAVATLATLGRLADPAGPYGSTVLFATATQPAFEVLDRRVARLNSVGWQPREVIGNAQPMYREAAARVRVAWRQATPISLAELAAELAAQRSVLTIVNLKRHAIELAGHLRDRGAKGLCHLSTNMCPAHRTEVLDRVRRRLQEGKFVRLVATQCVEAGVDLDFPSVYRALAPLEAVAQAAGRCNRHGSGPVGQVVVFKPQDDKGLYPPGYNAAVRAAEIFLASLAQKGDLDGIEILNNSERLRAYFRGLYDMSGRSADAQADEQELIDAMEEGNFAEVAKLYRLIKQDAIQLLVPYDRETFDSLRAELASEARREPGFLRDWFRRAAPYAVSLYRPRDDDSLWNYLEPIQFGRRPVERYETDWFAALPTLEYDRLTGLVRETESAWIA